jgi:translocation and assembly module TamB
VSTPAPVPGRDAKAAAPEAKPRRSRWRHARRAGWTSIALVALGLVLIAWLFYSIGGRDFLLARIVAALPADATLTWTSAEGPASGPMTLHDVRFAYRGKELRAAQVTLDPALQPLVWRKLRLDALQIRGATLTIAPSTEPFKLPQWPGSLPAIATPLPIQAERVEIDDLKVVYDNKPLLNVATLRGGVDIDRGRLHVEQLRIDSDRGRIFLHGDYLPAENYRMALKGSWHVAAYDGRPAARLGMAARGSLVALHAEVRGVAPGPVSASLLLGGRAPPHWTLGANLQGFDPALFTGAPQSAAWYASANISGEGGLAKLEGNAHRGDFELRVLPSTVRVQDQRLDLQPLALGLLGGTATLSGHADFTKPENASLQAQVQARGLHWGAGEAQVRANGDFHLQGSRQAWAAKGKAELTRADHAAQVDFDASGDAARAHVQQLLARMDTGRLQATGEVAWSPALHYRFDAKLAGFDPGYFAPDWPGAIDGQARIDGGRARDGGFDTHVVARELGGRLRQRPLSGHAEVRILTPAETGVASSYEGDLALRLGDSQVTAKGRIAQALQVDAKFEPLQLADWLPGAGGALRGTLQLRGARTAPDIDVDLAGTQLHYGSWSAGALQARGRLPWQRARQPGNLHVEGSALALGLPFDTLRADLRGAFEQLELDAQAQGARGTLALRGQLGRNASEWRGTLASLQLRPTQGAAWQLDQPTQFAWSQGRGRISPACLQASGSEGRLCVHGEWPGQGITLKGQGLSLALLQGYVPEREGGGRWKLHGDLALDARVQPLRSGGWSGVADLSSATGGIAALRKRPSGRPPPPDLSRYRDLRVHATFDAANVQATLASEFEGGGRIDAQVASGWSSDSALIGTVALATNNVGWLELFSPDIVAPTGTVEGHLQLGGTRSHPRLGGDATLANFKTEVPALGITLREGKLRMSAQADGNARLEGQLRSGEGLLHVDGTLGWGQETNPLQVHVTGKNVLASDTPELHALIDPDITVKYADGDAAIRVTGSVTVPEANIALEIFDRGALNSSDVVIVDPAESTKVVMRPVDVDLDIIAGDKVHMAGFGLDGNTRGHLRVHSQPGREVTASGALDVDGSYVAYGQRLQITRGRLLWSNSPISDPALDIRAERQVGDVTAGIDVHGRASAPVPTVWSNPSSSPSDAIAYLALGRPLSQASREESLQVGAARSALSLGGSLLAAQLGAKLGLDEAGVTQSRALGTEVIGAGKYLSPKLFVGYGVSLVGSGQVLTLKYLLRKGFDIEIESSTVENRASVNWRKEK